MNFCDDEKKQNKNGFANGQSQVQQNNSNLSKH